MSLGLLALCLKQWGFIFGWSSRNAVMILVIRNSKIEKLNLIKSQLNNWKESDLIGFTAGPSPRLPIH